MADVDPIREVVRIERLRDEHRAVARIGFGVARHARQDIGGKLLPQGASRFSLHAHWPFPRRRSRPSPIAGPAV